MNRKELPPTETPNELPPYEAPTVTTYSEEDILVALGDASESEPLHSLLS